MEILGCDAEELTVVSLFGSILIALGLSVFFIPVQKKLVPVGYILGLYGFSVISYHIVRLVWFRLIVRENYLKCTLLFKKWEADNVSVKLVETSYPRSSERVLMIKYEDRSIPIEFFRRKNRTKVIELILNYHKNAEWIKNEDGY